MSPQVVSPCNLKATAIYRAAATPSIYVVAEIGSNTTFGQVRHMFGIHQKLLVVMK
jgi:hypothetical protein